MDEVKIGPTRYHPFAPVFQNEGTNEGNVAIQSNYEEKQCGLDPSDIRWSYLLKPTFGDLKTVQRILSVQDMRRYTAETPYDKKNWMVAGLGLWHLRLNMLKLIHKIHWGGSKPMDSSTLQYAADAWDRSNVNTASDFTKLEELCIHSHHARITGLLLYSSGRDFTRREEAEEWLRTCSRARIVTLLDRIVELVNPNGFNDLKQTEPLNEVWYNHQCFIRHMNIYLLLCHAIKFADIGLLRQALREACVMFQAKEGQTTNYGPELLRLMHLYDSDASHPQLQRAMLVNSLVNLRGVYGKTFEVDRLVEFLNAFVAIVRKDRANSTKPMEELLRQIVLISPYMLELKRRLESQFGRPRSGEHPIKNASEDIWTMALNLVQRDFRYMDKEVFSAYLATNLTASGYDSLSDNVLRYNEKMASGVTMDDAIPTEENHSSTNTNSQSYESMDEVLESFLGTTT